MTTAADIFADVRRRFTWVADEEQFEKGDDWRSYADEVERGEPVRDDCDAFAVTCAELAVRYGIDPARVRVALCLTEVGQRQAVPPAYDHMVCLIDDAGDGYTLVLDCRQRAPVAWDRLGYRWCSSMRLSERGVWRWMAVGDAITAPVEIARPAAPVAPVAVSEAQALRGG